MTKRIITFLICIAAAATWSCTSPSSPSSVVKNIKVSGDTTMTVSDTTQYTASSVNGDGSTSDVTLRATWSSSNPAIAIVGPSGLVTAVSDGSVTITAKYDNISGTAKTVVSPLVVYSLTGFVSEAGFGFLGGARVQVLDGPSAGLSAATDGTGAYTLSGVRAATKFTLQTSLDGFLVDQRAMTLTRDSAQNIALYRTPPTGATARCRDATWSFVTDRTKACVANTGVSYWVCPGPLC